VALGWQHSLKNTSAAAHHGVWLLDELLGEVLERKGVVLLCGLGQQVDVRVHGNLDVPVAVLV
jgi:hypothetical protein